MSVPLCRSCRHYQYSNVGYTEHHTLWSSNKIERNYCKEFYVEVKQEATNCDRYDDKRNPDLDTMKESAWILEQKKKVGFDHPVIEFVKPEKK